MKYYDGIAQGYNELHGEEQKKKLDIIKKNLLVKKFMRLLDVGCGSGLSSDFDCDVIGIDPSKELVKLHKGNAVVGFAEKLPFGDAEFDIVVCISAIHGFSDIEKALSEIRRVGKDCFVISVLRKSKNFAAIDLLLRSNFLIENKVDEEKDSIYFLRRKG